MTITSFKEMDVYYAYFDVLSICMTQEIRLTRQGFHDECTLMQKYSYPAKINLSYVELRQGLLGSEDGKKKEKAMGKVDKEIFKSTIDDNFKGSVTGLFLNVYKDDIISLVFWPEEFIFGIMLNDYKIIPLKLNEASFNKICNVYKFKPREE